MSEKIYCPKFVAAIMPRIVGIGPLEVDEKDVIAKTMLCTKEECGYFSKKHNCCAIVAIAEKPPLTVALDIPLEDSDVEG
jgi:hypothetical protein